MKYPQCYLWLDTVWITGYVYGRRLSVKTSATRGQRPELRLGQGAHLVSFGLCYGRFITLAQYDMNCPVDSTHSRDMHGHGGISIFS